MNTTWQQRLQNELHSIQDQGLLRKRLTLKSAQGSRVVLEGREYLNFSSNDYLGLANNPEIRAAFKAAVDEYGVGSGASHLVVGHSEPYEILERQLAEWLGRERAIVFSSGYMANLGIFNALLRKRDVVFADKLNHASLVDAAIASPASVSRFRHADLAHLQALIEKQGNAKDSLSMIATDSVFSMDGDLADLPLLSKLAEKSGSLLMIDDAHGIGVLGATGAGSAEHFDLPQRDIPVVMGTFGKALGCAGAFVAGSGELIEIIAQRSRNYIYTTANPPALAAAVSRSIELVQAAPKLRTHLQELITRFKAGIAQMPFIESQAELMATHQVSSNTPIQPLILGDNAQAVLAAKLLRDRGLLVVAIRPPTVPRNTARLRVSLSAAQSTEDIDALLNALYDVCCELGVCT